MARVPYIEFDDLPAPFREQLAVAQRSNITRALANAPNVAITSGSVARYIRTGNSLDGRLRVESPAGEGTTVHVALPFMSRSFVQ